MLGLRAEKSVLGWVAGHGFRQVLVDWGAPGDLERRFTLRDHIAGRLEAALDAAAAAAGEPMAVMGYCMGGVLALAMAERRPKRVSALALLATPWDFHAERAEQAHLLGALMPSLKAMFSALGELPVDVLQTLFASLDPLLALRKFSRFAELEESDPRAREFLALHACLTAALPLPFPVPNPLLPP